ALAGEDLDPAVEDEQQRPAALTLLPGRLAVHERPLDGERRDPRDLRVGQRRKDLVRADARRDREGHALQSAFTSGTSTRCSERNQTCFSFVRITSETRRSFVPSSPASAACFAIACASLRMISC